MSSTTCTSSISSTSLLTDGGSVNPSLPDTRRIGHAPGPPVVSQLHTQPRREHRISLQVRTDETRTRPSMGFDIDDLESPSLDKEYFEEYFGPASEGSIEDPERAVPAWWTTLEVSPDPDATPKEIEAAYRTLARRHHPDKAVAKDRDDAAKRFQAISDAIDRARKEGYGAGR